MADPFSIIGLIGVAAQVIEITVNFGRDWKDVPEDTRALIAELQGLRAVLSTQIDILTHDDFRHVFLGRRAANLSQPDIAQPSMTITEMVLSCQTGLKDLLKVLKQYEDGHRVGWQRIKGAFSAKATRGRVEDLHRRCDILNKRVSINVQAETYSEVKAIRAEQQDRDRSEENKAMLAWLSNLSFEDTHRAVLAKRHRNTGQWFLDKDKFIQWRDGQSKTTSALWCPGMQLIEPSSVVIDHLRQKFDDATIGIAFVYCDYKDRFKQTPSNLFSSLVKQLARQRQPFPREVKDLYTKHTEKESLPSLDEYATLFSQFAASFSKTFIIVDGLDEHVGGEDDGFLNMEFIDQLRQVEQQDDMNGRMRLFVTSRENDTIRHHLDGCNSVNIQALASDIRALVGSRIFDNNFRCAKRLRETHKDLANTIVETLTEKAQGMLVSLPSKINSLYEGAMKRIIKQTEEDKDLALKSLSWVVRACRPLLLSELLIALALDPEDDDLDEESIPFDSLIASLTAGLLTMEPTLTGEDKTVRLVHFTVAEYFKKEGIQYLIHSEDHLAKTCLNYLLFDNMEPNLPMRQPDQRHGLYYYAANNWGHHVREASITDQALVMRFLDNEAKVNTCCRAINEYLNWPESKPLYLAAYFKLKESMHVLIKAGCDINAATPKGWTLLLSFAEKGQEEVVDLLLDNGADISPRATQGNTSLREPLAIAAELGHKAVVRVLLNHGADPNAGGQGDGEIRKGRTVPLVNAVKNRHLEIVQMLLGTEGIRVNERVEGHMTAYYWALRNNHKEMYQPLLSCGATL
ncbi:hypothetical protein N0V84_003320 [Fusarium piperis]|uniref:Ankyrin repeat protein n=1 Tax=Fusarium piperis TaxID=1435070 RepID=A0A9W9BSL0_9HYPO|nr:hypothetical protein N0V84_003320 [Fusarium piperis]